ncbi:fimbrial biogenesis chaperone [Candidatus Sodalis endolongispinus]
MVNNPTPYYITINKAMADGKRSLNIDMVAPFSSAAITQKILAPPRYVTWFITP